MKHKMIFLILGCVVLIGLASFVAIAENSSENSTTEKPKMKEVHTIVGPPENSCPFMERPSLEEEFKRVDLVFTGVLTDKIVEKMVVKREVPKKNIVRHRHITIFKSIFEVIEVFKSPINFDDKTIHVETLNPKKIGEEYIIYANIKNEKGTERIVSRECSRHKLVSKQGIEYWKSNIEKNKKDWDGLLFYGTLEYLKLRMPALKDKENSKKIFEAEFRIKEVLSNTTEQPVHDKNIIRALLNGCEEKPLLNQDYVFRVMPHKLEKISLEQVARGERISYIRAQFDGKCEKMIMIDEVSAVRRLVKEDRANEVKALFEDAERGN